MHPLVGKLEELTEEQLIVNMGKLTQRLTFAIRHGDGYLANQVRMMLDNYNSEQQRRYMEAEKEMQEQMGDKYKDKIKIE